MVNQRLAKIKERGEADFLSASIGRYTLWNAATMSHVAIDAQVGRLSEATLQVLREVKRVADHGFDQSVRQSKSSSV